MERLRKYFGWGYRAVENPGNNSERADVELLSRSAQSSDRAAAQAEAGTSTSGQARASIPSPPPPPPPAQAPAVTRKSCTAVIAIRGMSSTAHTDVVQRSLQRVLGVQKATVRLGDEEAEVEFDPDVITADELVRVAQGTGFQSELLSCTTTGLAYRMEAIRRKVQYWTSGCVNPEGMMMGAMSLIFMFILVAIFIDQNSRAMQMQSSMDVWILAGQSNAVGDNHMDGQEMPASGVSWPGRIFMFNSGRMWTTATPNVHYSVHGYMEKGGVGPEMAFARTLIESGISRRVGFVPTAMVGSSLYEQWRPGSDLYNYMITRTRSALATMAGARLRGIIWVQGETDGENQVAAMQYSHNFRLLVADARRDLLQYNPSLLFMVGIMAERNRTQAMPFIGEVRKQQLELAIPGVIKVDMAGYEFFSQQIGKHPEALTHLTKAGQCAFGAAMGHVYVEDMAIQAINQAMGPQSQGGGSNQQLEGV